MYLNPLSVIHRLIKSFFSVFSVSGLCDNYFSKIFLWSFLGRVLSWSALLLLKFLTRSDGWSVDFSDVITSPYILTPKISKLCITACKTAISSYVLWRNLSQIWNLAECYKILVRKTENDSFMSLFPKKSQKFVVFSYSVPFSRKFKIISF